MTWTIYCHIHTDSGRRYVGLTRLTMMRRWNSHVHSSNSSKGGKRMVTSHFANAIRKYGKDAFEHKVLETCDTLEAANAAEQRWIEELGTRDPEKGFNLAKGGAHIPHPKKNPWDRPEYRARMLEKNKELWENPEFRAKLSRHSKSLPSNPGFVAKMKDPAVRAARSLASRALFEDPVFKAASRRRCMPVQDLPHVPGRICKRCGNPGAFGKDANLVEGMKRVCKVCEKAAMDSRRDEVNGRRHRHKETLRSLVLVAKSNPCSGCKLSFSPDMMDLYSPGVGGRSLSWLVNHGSSICSVEEEISRCELLCFGCFRLRTLTEAV